MGKDISSIIEGWDYRPDEISVRRIIGDDGREKVQMRLDLGLLQMEIQGRPDGKRPYGKESLLEHYQSIVEGHRTKYGTDEKFKLDSEDCAKLQQEAIQYYYRYLCLFELHEYEGVKRDTQRNLRVFNLVKKYAADEKDKWAFEQYRPYVIMMNTRAKGLISLREKDYDNALEEIREGIERIKHFFREYDREDLIDECKEIAFLRNWKEQIQRNKPLTAEESLRKQLQEAIDREDFERAAELRDRIRRVKREDWRFEDESAKGEYRKQR